MMKKTFYTEWAYVLGIIAVAIATALTERADLGLSMVVAPAYLLHLILSPILPFVTFGTATYIFQGLLIALMCLVIRKFRFSYLFSFVTAVIYGYLLDLMMIPVSLIPADALWVRILLYVTGITVCSLGVSLMFHTYIKPEAYELFVKEVSSRFSLDINRTKIVYDISSCLLAVVISLIAFGALHGVGVGTVICAFVNGIMIGAFSRLFEKHFEFKDRLPKLKRIMD